MKNATRLAVCGVVTALSVVLLFIGGISFLLAYIMPMTVGVIMIMLKTTFGNSSAWITYAATSLLSFFLVTDKECALMYIMLFGFYPMVQADINKLSNKALKFIIKILIFNVLLFSAQMILIYVFGIPFLDEGEGKWLIALFAALMNILFIVYDNLLVNINKLYIAKVEKRIKKYFK